jgi:hypothetical protein
MGPKHGSADAFPCSIYDSSTFQSNMMAAHQQAMMFAKQAYQMAVAQQAMAAAAEEWERGSALSGIWKRG